MPRSFVISHHTRLGYLHLITCWLNISLTDLTRAGGFIFIKDQVQAGLEREVSRDYNDIYSRIKLNENHQTDPFPDYIFHKVRFLVQISLFGFDKHFKRTSVKEPPASLLVKLAGSRLTVYAIKLNYLTIFWRRRTVY